MQQEGGRRRKRIGRHVRAAKQSRVRIHSLREIFQGIETGFGGEVRQKRCGMVFLLFFARPMPSRG